MPKGVFAKPEIVRSSLYYRARQPVSDGCNAHLYGLPVSTDTSFNITPFLFTQADLSRQSSVQIMQVFKGDLILSS